MKKKAMVSALAAVAMMAVMPGVANAENAPSYENNYNPSYEYQLPDHAPSYGYSDGARSADIDLGGGVKVVVIGHGGDIQAPATTSTQASNTVLNDGWVAPTAKSLVVEPTSSAAWNGKSYKGAKSATLIFNLGDKYEGAEVKVFAQHGDNTTDVYTGTKVSGKISTVEVSKLSTFTVVVKPASGTKGKNTSSKSPVTGVLLADVAEYVADLF